MIDEPRSGKLKLLGSAFGTLLFLVAGAGTGEGQQPQWEKEWQRTVAAAKKEGQLNVFSSTGFEEVFREFQKRYSEIKVNEVFVRGGPDPVARFMAERRAEKYLIDLRVAGSTTTYRLYQTKTLDPIRPALILPEVLDESKWWQGEHGYVDPEREYILSFNGQVQVDAHYNTNLVKPDEIKSYWDLLNPKWKGRIVALDPRFGAAGASMRFLYYNPELGPKYLRRLLTEMDLTYSRDARQIVDWLASGKFAVSLIASTAWLGAREAKQQGLPVAGFTPRNFKEGAILTAAAGSIALINRAPHPNAARVAINWLLSREGQIRYQMNKYSANSVDSLRTDIPKDSIRPESRRQDGVNLINVDRAEWADMKPVLDFVDEVRSKGTK